MIAPCIDHSAKALAVGLLLLLGACASESSNSGTPVETGTALPPPEPGAPSAAGDLSTTQVKPVEAPENKGQAASEGVEPMVIKGPDGQTWQVTKPKNESAYRADIEDCYRYASAQTRRDAQIIDDRNAGIDTMTNQSAFAGLRQRVDEYDLRNRRAALMSSCMQAKGYAQSNSVLPRLEF